MSTPRIPRPPTTRKVTRPRLVIPAVYDRLVGRSIAPLPRGAGGHTPNAARTRQDGGRVRASRADGAVSAERRGSVDNSTHLAAVSCEEVRVRRIQGRSP